MDILRNKSIANNIENLSHAKTTIDNLKDELTLSSSIQELLKEIDTKKSVQQEKSQAIDTYYHEKSKAAGSNNLTSILTDSDQIFINKMYEEQHIAEQEVRHAESNLWKTLENNNELKKEYLAYLERISDRNARHLKQNIPLN